MYNLKMKYIAGLFFIILTLMSSLRYGSGTDYFSYMWHYNINPTNIVDAVNLSSNMNIGYRIIMAIAKALNLEFESFIGIISIIIMITYMIIIYKNSKMPMVSILIFYGFYQPIYVNSAIRQGIAMVIFLIAFFRYFKNGKFFKYIILVCLGGLFHYSILIVLIVPFIDYLYKKRFKDLKFNIIILLISLISFMLNGEIILVKMASFVGINIPYSSGNSNVLAIFLRIILITIVFVLYVNSDKRLVSEFDKKCIYIYFINTVIFIAVSNMGILSRMIDFLSLLDIFIFANCISYLRDKKIRAIVSFVLIFILAIVFCKDQISFLAQGNYFSNNLFDYPYVSIFNKNDIYKYRYIYLM
ncbi:EpsG family protein [Clostridium perfringens]|nr:EpsG family protein [Clostridium perfringens]